MLDNSEQSDLIFMDMSKAFDKVSHAAFINKFKQFNISGNLWIGSLHDQRQHVTTLAATETVVET